MTLDKSRSWGEAWVERDPNGGWIVNEVGGGWSLQRHHRFWIIAFLDWRTC